jgi:DNA-directed RNA polymerase subunit RPC12/RpoP
VEAFAAGTLAGAGSFRCEGCGYKIALHELDEVPGCPQCGSRRFKRASIFTRPELADEDQTFEVEEPDWLEDARAAQVVNGDYLAFERDHRVHVVPLQDGWTRVGRSLSAHIRFDDPTVSRRHALLHRDRSGVRVLDDRSLNGVHLNGERVDWHELEDGDEIAVGAFRLYYLAVRHNSRSGASSLKLAPGA